jgi:ParB family chromosome partitioning protein
MASFMRDVLTTLSYEPDPAQQLSPDGAAELSKLDRRLAGFVQGGWSRARTTISIRPGDCSIWDGNPRDIPRLSYDGCRTLIESIAQEDGNRIPILVRVNPPGALQPYELLVGSRRRFAVEWLNNNGRPEIRLNAVIVELSDEEAFRLADIENREREDITELDRARSYQAAVDRFYGGVQSRMAEALTLSNSQLSRLLSLAEMPEVVVEAFATRDELRVRHSEVLTPILRRPGQREQVLAAARQIGDEQQRLAAADKRLIPAATVLTRLKQAGLAGTRAVTQEQSVMLGADRVGKIRQGRDAIAVELAVTDAVDLDVLLERVKALLVQFRAAAGSPPA